MSEEQSLSEALTIALPPHFHDQIESIVHLILALKQDAAEKSNKPNRIAATPEMAQVLKELEGRDIKAGSTLVSFGEETQNGDISIRDVVKGNSITIHLHSANTPPPGKSIEDKKKSPKNIELSRPILITLTLIIGIIVGLTGGYAFALNNLRPQILSAYNVEVASQKNYRLNKLSNNAQVYIDRPFFFLNIPKELEGRYYILASNDDKFSTTSDFIKFQINQSARVFVAHNDCYIVKPSWLSQFRDAGTQLTTNNAEGTTGTYHLFYKDLNAGNITLGGNIIPGELQDCGMYIVIISPK